MLAHYSVFSAFSTPSYTKIVVTMIVMLAHMIYMLVSPMNTCYSTILTCIHTIILWIYDLPVGLPQVTEDRAYGTLSILASRTRQNRPALIPWEADSAVVESVQQPCFERASPMV